MRAQKKTERTLAVWICRNDSPAEIKRKLLAIGIKTSRRTIYRDLEAIKKFEQKLLKCEQILATGSLTVND